MNDYSPVGRNGLFYRLIKYSLLSIPFIFVIEFLALLVFKDPNASSFTAFGAFVFMIVCLAGAAIAATVESRHLGYLLGTEALGLQTGLIHLKSTSFPYAAIKHLIVSQTFFQKFFKVADLAVGQESQPLFQFNSIDQDLAFLIYEEVLKRNKREPTEVPTPAVVMPMPAAAPAIPTAPTLTPPTPTAIPTPHKVQVPPVPFVDTNPPLSLIFKPYRRILRHY